jgi:hypothetical protein
VGKFLNSIALILSLSVAHADERLNLRVKEANANADGPFVRFDFGDATPFGRNRNINSGTPHLGSNKLIAVRLS